MSRLLRFPPVYVCGTGAVGGYEERRGPFGECFDLTAEDDRFGMPSFEQAEGEMARMALSFALGRAGLSPAELGLLFAGDLQNQCVASSQGLSGLPTPFLGLFGACSTMVEGMGLAALALTAAPTLPSAAALSSSHNAAAERQFRTPLEYGSQRTPTAQWTATAAGAAVLGRQGRVAVTAFLPGRICDAGITDAANMGAAMAPAAADTLLAYFRESGERPEDFDLILTGDLGHEGSVLLRTLLSEPLPTLDGVHEDGGCLFYGEEKDVHGGASGCGCIASLLAAVFLPRLERGELTRMLAVGTGALMNPGELQQGGAIAGVAHLVRIEATGQEV
ncbi:MAG: stage V sporulation protein AD [Clostridia bacterium]|nr:stage V sporulation protein AD [Clostridia bacterium]